ncbi:MAG: DUF4115 domain-containing protein [Acidobacteria bacterium]|nr:DUF4115 domain-containing protein [Acidobacteriota bacterium]
MTSVGDTLRRAREQRKLNLEDVSRELKISHRLLEAMEADQYERLPGTIFAKAFVRQYANLLSLDGEDLAAQVGRAMEPPVLDIGPSEKSKPAVNPVDVPRVEEWSSVGDRRFRPSGSLSAAALVVVVMLICSAVYAWMQRPRYTNVHTPPPAVAHNEPAPRPEVPQTAAQQPAASVPVTLPAPSGADAKPPAGESAQPAASPLPAAPPPVQAAAAAQPATPAPATPPGPVHVEIVADEQAWVAARADGKYVFSGTLDPGGRRTVDANTEVVVRLGNAGGVSLLLNGKTVGAVGPKGQVRTVQFTSGGFQIVPPKPPAPDPLSDR